MGLTCKLLRPPSYPHGQNDEYVHPEVPKLCLLFCGYYWNRLKASEGKDFVLCLQTKDPKWNLTHKYFKIYAEEMKQLDGYIIFHVMLTG